MVFNIACLVIVTMVSRYVIRQLIKHLGITKRFEEVVTKLRERTLISCGH